MASKASALHHQYNREPNRLVVLKKHAKTADLGLEDGTLIVSGCPIGPQTDPHRSYCVIEADAPAGKPPTKAELTKAAKELRAKADAAAVAAKAASDAAEAGKESEQADDLIKAAIAAGDEAAQAALEADAAEAALK